MADILSRENYLQEGLMAKKMLRKMCSSKVETFKIKNRRGYAAICMGNLTGGNTVGTALDRMAKALKRSGYLLIR